MSEVVPISRRTLLRGTAALTIAPPLCATWLHDQMQRLVKRQVRVPTITTVAPVMNIDGLSLEDGDFMLFISAEKPAESGVYVVSVDTWERAAAPHLDGGKIECVVPRLDWDVGFPPRSEE